MTKYQLLLVENKQGLSCGWIRTLKHENKRHLTLSPGPLHQDNKFEF